MPFFLFTVFLPIPFFKFYFSFQTSTLSPLCPSHPFCSVPFCRIPFIFFFQYLFFPFFCIPSKYFSLFFYFYSLAFFYKKNIFLNIFSTIYFSVCLCCLTFHFCNFWIFVKNTKNT
ncbi:unnamed protein product [Meloidogyne enterolobii]|uniref:Uncharacterized protein n=1 Tax=Meloidogyne enterolobii TaxID=390850 RepID=A0ACB0ZLJ9_MELEN